MHFVVKAMNAIMTAAANINPQSQLVAAIVLAKPFSAVQFLWHQMVKGQSLDAQAARTAVHVVTPLAHNWFDGRIFVHTHIGPGSSSVLCTSVTKPWISQLPSTTF